MLRPWMLITAILLAVGRTRNSPRYLRLYLIAELISTVGIELSYYIFGWGASIATVLYCLFRFIELCGAAMLGRQKFLGLLFGLAMGVMALAGIRSPNLYSMIALAEGIAFFTLGASLAFSLGFHTDKLTGAILSITWIFLGIFDLGYAMDWQKQFWQELNAWWPSAVCILAFCSVAIFKCPVFRVSEARYGRRDGLSGAGLSR